jgi:hypothetical protein
MAANAATRAAAYASNIRQQMKLRGTDAEKDQYLDDMWRRNLAQQPSLIGKDVGSNYTKIDAQKSLPVYTLENGTVKQLIPIDGEPVYPNGTSKPTKSTDKPLYYKGGHYEPVYRYSEAGHTTDVSKDQMAADYYQFKQTWKKLNKAEWPGDFDSFVKQAVQNNKYNVILKGANGSADEQLSRAAQRIISNKDTKKFQEGVFSNEYNDEQIPDNEPPERQ